MAGCVLLDAVLTNSFLLILSEAALLVSADMRDSKSLQDDDKPLIKFQPRFNLRLINCDSIEVRDTQHKYRCAEQTLNTI